ncbi:MAG: cell wall metabolism sensor histidine kinase WalK [Desulfobacula sp.]|nr:cell wall metabolism sensor histidine kinase WalK [Desulfobacula sp.]
MKNLKSNPRKNQDKKKRLVWQIFPLFLIIIIFSLSFVAYYSTSYFKNFFMEIFEKELSVRTKLLQNNLNNICKSGEQSKAFYIDKYCKDIGEKTDTRVTVILPSGVVTGDSFANIKTMGNHIQRPEIRQALKRKKGVSIRYSATLDTNMMYIALPVITDGSVTAVVRTAVSVSVIDKKIRLIRNNIFAALLLSIIAAGIAGLYVTKRIARPVEQMREGAVQFAKGNLKARLAVPDTRELSQLAVTMNQMAQNLDEKIEEFKNRSMELEAVHASMQEGVIAIDQEKRIITINDAAAKVFDLSAQGLKKRYIFEVARNIEFQRFIEKALATHIPFDDNIVITRDNDLILNIHSTALYDSSKNRMGTLIIFHDITRIKKLETMHKDFASDVSHELKTPLTTIKGFIETIQGISSSNNIKDREKFLKIIERNINRMIDLINDLLSLSRLERQQGTDIQFENQDMKVLVKSAVTTCQNTIYEKEITINFECPKDISAMVDPILMEQAIVNLVDNAVKYSRRQGQIDLTILKIPGFIEIEVKDQGCGINQEHQSRIFNRFYRVDKARSRQQGGTGLGLAIVKHIVQYHGGKIKVNSEKNKGSSFIITIPA